MTSNLSFQRLLFCALLENLVANNVAVILRFFLQLLHFVTVVAKQKIV